MKRMQIIPTVLLFCFISFLGCAAATTNLPHGLMPKNSMGLREYREWSLESVGKLSIYLNKPKEELRYGMGNPIRIQYDVISSRKHYDEIWFYHYSRGIPLFTEQSWGYTFYINDNIVVDIEAY